MEETKSPENEGAYAKGRPGEKHKVHKEHPGLGEGGRYHVKEDENPLPKGTELTFALAGNQNCGKTTLFNQLPGANASRLIKKAVPSGVIPIRR